MKLKDSLVLITGSNRGIGRAVALACAKRGARLLLANRTSDEALKEECVRLGAKAVTLVRADLGSKADIEAFLSMHGASEVDVLFNNAGQLTGGLLEEQPLDDIYAMMQTNVNALIHLTHHFLPGMVTRKRGKIVNHASVSSYMHFPCASTYSASKAAVAAFSECLRTELGGTGVDVLLLVTPGVNTRMFDEIKGKYEGHLDLKFLSGIPPEVYAERVCEAIEADLERLEPAGSTGISLKIAKHAPKMFRKIATSRFKR